MKRWALRVAGVLVAVVLLAVVTIYAWPLGSDHLTHAAAALSFPDARSRAAAEVAGVTVARPGPC